MSSHIIYGRHPLFEVLKAGRRKVFSISYATAGEKGLGEILRKAEARKIPLRKSSRRELSDRTGGANHQGVVADVGPPANFELNAFIKRMTAREKVVVVALDSISDPHNFGAILRSAESLGVAGAMFPKDRSCDINSTVVKTSAGATEYLDFCRVTNLARALREMRKAGFHCVSAEENGDIDIGKFNPLFPLVIVMGAEGKGVRPLVRKQCHESISIPLSGSIASLNVSSAAAIIFHEILKIGQN